jgi:CMP/dCMP kinase
LKKLVIAIDGPAASGKTTTARLTAERLGYLHVDTGAMYRAITLKVLREKISLDDVKRIEALVANTSVSLSQNSDRLKIILDDCDVTTAIRDQAVTKAVSAVSSIKNVRELMVQEQRRMGKEGGVVLEGRDIGTVVFPDADLKIFMIADVKERARRRQTELKAQKINVSVNDLVQEILSRDEKDSGREISPLCKADDAIVLDTSDLTIDEQVDFIVGKAKDILNKSSNES